MFSREFYLLRLDKGCVACTSMENLCGFAFFPDEFSGL